ncbi:hypothetical protein [Chitiniphilus eburneus]|uniref:STAS domain-containing protein n=1 Tax=Chitiniphilus eburneus TaxID=2571148 RepID=A0A4V5MS47_9NEIS|nr:hypothetical protein [Chitiniphilus eburneus]TJZ78748.1 hypothetical protein FAZ21_00195 [Chitiniphilus eburneus]
MFRADNTQGWLEGVCGIDDVAPLLDWLLATPGARLDLAGCRHLHCAVIQLLLSARPRLIALPADAWMARFLSPTLAGLAGVPTESGPGPGHPTRNPHE